MAEQSAGAVSAGFFGNKSKAGLPVFSSHASNTPKYKNFAGPWLELLDGIRQGSSDFYLYGHSLLEPPNMHLDPIITRRFAELRQKAEAVLAAKIVDFHDQNGKPFYKVPSGAYKEWATNVLNLLQRTFNESSVHFKHFAESYNSFQGWLSDVDISFGIFKAAEEDYLGGYLFQIRTLAKAEVLSDALEQAKELLRLGYKDPACILARVALESTLKDLSAKHGVVEGKLDRMNAELTKAGAFNVVKQKQITAWADIGNKAAHGDWSSYTDADAMAMVSGVEALVADL